MEKVRRPGYDACRIKQKIKDMESAMHKIFIDGQEGTTGLEIKERLEGRKDVELLEISGDKRKDPAVKKIYQWRRSGDSLPARCCGKGICGPGRKRDHPVY